MKKFLIVALAVLTMGVAASAQPKAIGLRIANGAEVSYQHYMGGANFLELDLGFFSNTGLHLTGVYDFNLGSAGIVNFYAGPGAALGLYSYVGDDGKSVASFSAAVVGQIGAEVEIPDFPLNISLDWRPAFYLTGGLQGFGWSGFGLGLRYRF